MQLVLGTARLAAKGTSIVVDEDVAFTRNVAGAAALVGVPMFDHVIVARRRSVSIVDRVNERLPLPRQET